MISQFTGFLNQPYQLTGLLQLVMIHSSFYIDIFLVESGSFDFGKFENRYILRPELPPLLRKNNAAAILVVRGWSHGNADAWGDRRRCEGHAVALPVSFLRLSYRFTHISFSCFFLFISKVMNNIHIGFIQLKKYRA